MATHAESLRPITSDPTAPATEQEDKLLTFKAPPHAAELGLGLYIAGMSVAFFWLLFGYLMMKGRADLPPVALPAWFWLSTAWVLLGSLAVHWAWRGADGASAPTVRHGLLAANATGLAFLVCQVLGFSALWGAYAAVAGGRQMALMIIAISVLHGVHLLGGLACTVILAHRALTVPDYCDAHHLRLAMIYWHFLTVLWMIIFGLFLLAPGIA